MEVGLNDVQKNALRDLNNSSSLLQGFAIFVLLVFVIYFGLVYTNTTFEEGYPRYASPPIPGNYYSDRWSFQWVWLIIPSINVLLPYMAIWATINPLSRLPRSIYFYTTIIFLIITIIIAFWMLFIWFARNSPWYYGNQASDIAYCAVYYANFPLRCPNAADVPIDPPNAAPVYTSGDLGTNITFILHWVFQGGFILLVAFHLGISASLNNACERVENVADL